VYARVDAASLAVRTAVHAAFDAVGLPHAVQVAGNLFSTVLGTDAGARDYAGMLASEHWRYPAFFHSLLAQGVYAPPSAFEAWFLSAAHDEEAVGRVLAALPAAARAAAEARPPA
jgi:glutamate-1-semialdehyde 2,1-aminomutase